ncbi:NADH dehydrogenase subunit 4L (mitochondrion) [Procambarus clarkii]|uniref:NADH-ubiquinone oxidoreductase chain 4L n=1 Tax=Procambarus clarkii TaxID=6728 RepID=H6VY67_PROCL|nr:NADH dehydrogenase subunit 4L [Procambarus clarkii]AEV51230.1 nad4L [Procambarus clarkii]AFQ31574.1 NADH dehydrogenase subunit 4l [Procambarus clarkii]AKZ17604.1 NADH dehydrogenase subunit 4L [Procambarus clarkii]APS87321.1 NADH dehydrogenase subunit 4L [Procambarus clarkii]UUF68381.1 NADH dehydrogenase subunit 4L [Procambarus clarkii]
MNTLNLVYICSLAMLFCGGWSFVSNRKHLLNTLLSLEFVMLSVFWIMVLYIMSVGIEMYFVLFFLTLGVCEGALGLSLLISIVCSHGNDYFGSFNVV